MRGFVVQFQKNRVWGTTPLSGLAHTHRDGTQYGSRRGATRSFRHHTSEISSAFVYADAETLSPTLRAARPSIKASAVNPF